MDFITIKITSMEINKEALEQLSIADLWAMYKFAEMFKDDFCYRLSEKDKCDDIIYYTKEEINKRISNIFIF